MEVEADRITCRCKEKAKGRGMFIMGCSNCPEANESGRSFLQRWEEYNSNLAAEPNLREGRPSIVIEELEILPDEDGMYRFAAPIPAGTKFRLRYPEDMVSASTAR